MLVSMLVFVHLCEIHLKFLKKTFLQGYHKPSDKKQ